MVDRDRVDEDEDAVPWRGEEESCGPLPFRRVDVDSACGVEVAFPCYEAPCFAFVACLVCHEDASASYEASCVWVEDAGGENPDCCCCYCC